MDLNLFKDKIRKENILTINGIDYDKSNIMGGVNYNQTVNSGTDIVLGSCTCATIEFQLNNLNQSINNLAGKEINWKIRVETSIGVFEDKQMGIFIAEKPTKVNDTRMKVKAYDRMIKFDKIVDDWLRTVSYPTTLKNLLTGLCNHVGVTLSNTTFLNDNYPVKFNFLGTNVKGRDVLKWIAEIAAKYAIINEQGQLRLGWYNNIVYSVNNSNYYNVKVEDYQVKKIDKLQVQVEENDIGIIVGAGTNAYVIQNNPLLYAATDAEIRPYVTLIYNAIKDFTYIPYEIKVNANPLIKAGNSFQVTTRKGQVFNAVVMSRKMTSGNDVYSATGNASRPINTSLNQSIRQLRGKTNVLDRTLERTISKLYDADTGDLTVLTQTVDNISLTVSSYDGRIGTLELTANSLESRISATETSVTEIEDTTSVIASRLLSAEEDLSKVDTNIANAMSNAISSANDNTATLLASYSTTSEMNSAISQTANQINLSVDAKITDTISVVNQTTDTKLLNYSKTSEMNSAIDLKADEINLSVDTRISETIEGLINSDGILTNYSTTTEMNTAIALSQDSILSTVSVTYATKSSLNNYSTTTQMNSAITQKANSITLSVSETYATKTSVSTLTQTVGGFETRVSNAEGSITTLTQTTSGITAAVNNSKLTFDTSGLTIKNGGFQIINPNTVPNLLPSYRNLTVKYAVSNSNKIYINQTFTAETGNALIGRLVLINNKQYQIIYIRTDNYTIEVDEPVIISAGTTIYPSDKIFSIESDGKVTMTSSLYNLSDDNAVTIDNGRIDIFSQDLFVNNSQSMDRVGTIYGVYDSDMSIREKRNLIISAYEKLTLRTDTNTTTSMEIHNWSIHMNCEYIYINGTRLKLKQLGTVGTKGLVLAQY